MSSADNNENVWQNATTWIQRNGGHVNPVLDFDATHRQVTIRAASNEDTPKNDDTSIPCSNDVPEGEVLMKIPYACLLSLHSVESTSFGKSLFVAVHSLLSSSEEDVRRFNKRARLDANVFVNRQNEVRHLYNDEQDVILAFFLAYLIEQLRNERIKQKESNLTEMSSDKSTSPWLFFRPYLETLCTQTSSPVVNDPTSKQCSLSDYTELLPRQWSIDTIKRRLQGTSLYHRVLAEKNGLIREYKAVHSAWIQNNFHPNNDSIDIGLTTASFPSLESYDVMMALVTSRGFVGLGYEGVDVMIPLLDLLNHVRGGCEDGSTLLKEQENNSVSDDDGLVSYGNTDGGECFNGDALSEGKAGDKYWRGRTADVRYERYENNHACGGKQDDNISEPKPHFEGNGGGVMVTAARHLSPGTQLHMTYGAKGNATLLGRYGFCIENNLEPDGSCNDVLEIQLRPNTLPIRLQRGPKSYSYSPFVEALQLFYNNKENVANGSSEKCSKPIRKEGVNNSGSVQEATSEEETERDHDLEAFLDECDNESDDGDETSDCYIDESRYIQQSIMEKTTFLVSQHQEQIEADMSALKSLIIGLSDAKLRCATNEFACTDGRQFSTQEHYCSIFVQSEIRTLSFFIEVSKTLERYLVKLRDFSQSAVEIDECTYGCDAKEAKNQILDIVKAVLTIRYSIVRC